MSLIEVLVATGLTSIVLAATYAISNLQSKQQLQSNSVFQVDQIRRSFTTTLQSGAAWNKTLNDPNNLAFDCIRNQTDCSSQGGGFRVLDASGAPLLGYDPMTSTSQGFTASGAICSGFSSTAGSESDACPYRLNLVWEPVCPGGGAPCINPSIKLMGTWAYHPKTPQRTIAFNPQNYGFQVVQGALGPNSFVFAQALGSQSIVSGALPAVLFPSVLSDNLGEFDGTFFSPGQSGVYLVSFNVSLGPTQWNTMGTCSSIMLKKGATNTPVNQDCVYPANSPNSAGSTKGTHSLHLNAGDQVWIRTYHNMGGTIPAVGGPSTTFSVSRLQ